MHNCSEDVAALAFISGLRVTHPLSKHLVKYNVTRWSEILYLSQPYIQIEEAMKSFANQSLNHGDDEENPKTHHGGASVNNPSRGQDAFKKRLFSNPQQSPLRAYRVNDGFTPLKLLIQNIFKAIKDQP